MDSAVYILKKEIQHYHALWQSHGNCFWIAKESWWQTVCRMARLQKMNVVRINHIERSIENLHGSTTRRISATKERAGCADRLHCHVCLLLPLSVLWTDVKSIIFITFGILRLYYLFPKSKDHLRGRQETNESMGSFWQYRSTEMANWNSLE